jgi:hypothetical protein
MSNEKTYRGCDYDPKDSKKVELKFEWNWKAQMHSIIKLLEMGNGEGKKYAREELLKLAEKLDAYNEAHDIPSGIFNDQSFNKNG